MTISLPIRTALKAPPVCALALAVVASPTLAQETGGSGEEGVVGAIEIPEAEESRGVFISQIGTTNRADVSQDDSGSFARIIQNGADNSAELSQNGAGTHRASAAQEGDGNVLLAEQAGTGDTTLLFAQEGDTNSAILLQRETSALSSAAAILQSGDNNNLTLIQDGSDNQARLTQDGNANTMTATQLNSGNRLDWKQQGDGLSDLRITQEGGSTMEITQSNTGAAFAPPPNGSGG